MKIGDRVYHKITKLPAKITDIMGNIIWVNSFTPYNKSFFITIFMTETELRKEKLEKLNQ